MSTAYNPFESSSSDDEGQKETTETNIPVTAFKEPQLPPDLIYEWKDPTVQPTTPAKPKVEKEKVDPVGYDPTKTYTKDELRAMYGQLLRKKKMNSTWTQDLCLATTKDHPVSGLLKLGQKRQVIQNLRLDLKEEEREKVRKKQRKAEEEFVKLLLECKTITKEMSYRDAMKEVSYADTRFLAITNDRERERLFYVYLDERDLQEKQEANRKHDEAFSVYARFLREDANVTLDTSWPSFHSVIKTNRMFDVLGVLECLNLFTQHITSLEEKETEKINEENKLRDRRARKCRAEFKNLVESFKSSGMLRLKMRWKRFRLFIETAPRYLNMLDCEFSGSTPAELFYDAILEMKEKYKEDVKFVKGVMKEKNTKVLHTSTFQEFSSAVGEDLENVSSRNVQLFFGKLRDKAETEELKTKPKNREKFHEVLSQLDIAVKDLWQNVASKISLPESLSFLTEAQQQEYFEEYVNKLLDKEDEDQRRRQRQTGTSSGTSDRRTESDRGDRDREGRGDRDGNRTRDDDKDRKDYRDHRDRDSHRSDRDRDHRDYRNDRNDRNDRSDRNDNYRDRERERDRDLRTGGGRDRYRNSRGNNERDRDRRDRDRENRRDRNSRERSRDRGDRGREDRGRDERSKDRNSRENSRERSEDDNRHNGRDKNDYDEKRGEGPKKRAREDSEDSQENERDKKKVQTSNSFLL